MHDQNHELKTTSLSLNNRRMTTLTWRDRLAMAGTEADVVDVVRDYVAQLEHFEISQLPEERRPGRFHDGFDVMEYAFALARNSCQDSSDAAAQELVFRLAAFFSRASFRLSQVTARTNGDE